VIGVKDLNAITKISSPYSILVIFGYYDVSVGRYYSSVAAAPSEQSWRTGSLADAHDIYSLRWSKEMIPQETIDPELAMNLIP